MTEDYDYTNERLRELNDEAKKDAIATQKEIEEGTEEESEESFLFRNQE